MGRLQANSSLVKTNKISVKKQNLGGGKISLYKKPFAPNALQGLSLWLKADAGTTTEAEYFISSIVVSEAGTPSANGTYSRASGGETSFTNPNGSYIDFVEDDLWSLSGYVNDEVYDEPLYLFTIQGNNIVEVSQDAWGQLPLPTTNTSLTATGNIIVTAWADQSGNGNNAVGSDTLPTLQSNAINGYAAIRFNNINSDVSKFIISNNFNLKNSSVFVVVKQLNLDNPFARMLGFLGSNNDYDSDDGLAFLFNNFANQLQLTSNGNDAIIPNLVANNVFAVVSYKINNSGNISVFYNGASEGTGQNSNMGSQNSGGLLYIGQGSQDVTAAGLDGDIVEVILYNSNLTTLERQQVEAYLNAKYNIY